MGWERIKKRYIASRYSFYHPTGTHPNLLWRSRVLRKSDTKDAAGGSNTAVEVRMARHVLQETPVNSQNLALKRREDAWHPSRAMFAQCCQSPKRTEIQNSRKEGFYEVPFVYLILTVIGVGLNLDPSSSQHGLCCD